MKRLVVLLFCAAGIMPALAQVPKLINYQGVVRDASGTPLINRVISVKMELRTGGGTGSTQWEATETLTTSAQGLFTTQIGKLNTAQFESINWNQGDLFLVVAVDTSNGSSHVEMGAQQLVSVPYAIHALSVPVSFTNNVLTIGQQTVGFEPGPTYTAGTGISIVSGSIVSTPTLSLNNNELSISGGNTVTLTTESASLVSTGAAVTSTLAPNSYSIHVEPPSFSPNGPVTISGSHPNFTVNSATAADATIATTGIITHTTSGNTFTLSAREPTITSGNSNVQVNGTYPTFTISATPSLGISGNSITISNGNSVPMPVTTVTDNGGPVSVTGAFPSYTVNSTAPTFTHNGGPVTVSGSHPNFTVTSSAPTFTHNGGPVTVNGSHPNFTVSSTAPTFTNNAGGPVTVSGTYPNFTVNSSANNATITPGGIVQHTVSGNSHTLSAAGATLVAGNSNIAITGSHPTFNIASTPSLTLTGSALSISHGNSVNFSAISPWRQGVNTVTLANVANRVGIGTNNPTQELQVEAAANPAISIIAAATSTANLHLGDPSNHFRAGLRYSNVTDALGIWTNSANRVTILGNGNMGVGYNNPSATFAVGTSTAEKLNISGVNGSMNFLDDQGSITFPVPTTSAQPMIRMFAANAANPDRMVLAHSAANPSTGLQYQDAGDKFNFLSSGSPVLSVDLTNQNVGVGTSSPNHFGSTTGRFLTLQSTDSYGDHPAVLELIGSSASFSPVGRIDFNSLFTANTPTTTARISHLTNGSIYQGALAFSTHNGTTLAERMRISEDGKVGLGESQPDWRLTLFGQAGSANNGSHMVFRTSEDAHPTMQLLNWNHSEQWLVFNGYLSAGNAWTSSDATGNYAIANIKYGTDALVFRSAQGVAPGSSVLWNNVMAIKGNSVGIGTVSPAAPLHVAGKVRIADGTQGADRVLTSDAAGTASWRSSPINTGFMAMSNLSQTVASGPHVQVNFGSEDYDDGNNFSGSGYTCPTAGVYHFDASVSWYGFVAASNWTHIFIYRNGTPEITHMEATSTNYFSNQISATIKCNANDVITIRVLQQSGTVQSLYTISNYTWFTGHKVY